MGQGNCACANAYPGDLPFIGVKMVWAQPAKRFEAAEILGISILSYQTDDDGYIVTYPDGYRSWSPKETFEKAYFQLSDATRITENDVERMMGPLEGVQISPKSTLVKAEQSLIGFETYNVSSCVSPDNYSTEIGVKYGSKPIKDEFWQCLGFVLQWARNGLK